MPKYKDKKTGRTTLCGVDSAYDRIAKAHPAQFEPVAVKASDPPVPDEAVAATAAEKAKKGG